MKLQNYFWLLFMIFICMLKSVTIFAQTVTWKQTNGPFGGHVNAIAFNSRGDIFAGTHYDGVYRSTNEGNDWIHVGLDDEWVTAIVIDSLDYIYVGTYYHSVHRSTNNGVSWKKMDLNPSTYVTSITINSYGHIFVGRYYGISRSTDHGETWIEVGTSLKNYLTNALCLAKNGDIIAGLSSGMYRSTNNGDTWTQSQDGLPKFSSGSLYVSALTTHQESGSIYAGIHDLGVYRSTNNGISWIPANHGLQNYYVGPIALNSDGDIFVSTLNGVFRSTNQGANWADVNYGLKGNYASALAVDKNDRLLAGTSGNGVFLSFLYGDHWREFRNGFINSMVYSLIIVSNQTVCAGIDGGIFLTTDHGNNWQQTLSMKYVVRSFARDKNGHVFASTTGAGIYRSSDEGLSWNRISDTNIVSNSYQIIFDITGNIYACTARGVHRSTDNCQTWSTLGLYWDDVYALVIGKNGYLFAGTRSNVQRSTNGGKFWIPCTIEYYQGDVHYLAVDKDGVIYGASLHAGKMIKSTDNGDTWISIQTPLQDTWHSGLIISSSSEIFVSAGSAGIIRSTDKGQTWTSLNSGLEKVDISCLAIDHDGYMYAGTDANGVFRTTQSITNVADHPAQISTQYDLYQNYPNPFCNSTTIHFSVPQKEHITIKVIDVLGRERKILEDNIFDKGEHRFEYDAHDLPSGIYYFTMSNSKKIITRSALHTR